MFVVKVGFHYVWKSCKIALCFLLISSPALAQVVPDHTLPDNSRAILQNNTNIITGGTRAGTNLFHSFQQFSISTGGIAYFNNALDVQNIISRVTGTSISNIDGLIQANGTANLFLINPNGIIFGHNASLNIGGSFVGSTASSINFADGTQLGATAAQTTPLLTISVPIGLQFAGSPGSINVQGRGNTFVNPIYSPIFREGNSTGLAVQTGKTLALIGGDVNLDGGILTAPGGHIELGSASNGLVSISPTTSGWNFGYQSASNFKAIRLFQQALADASGASGGSVSVQGRLVSLRDGSVIFIQNQGPQPSGSIGVNASDFMEVNGTSPDGRIASTLLTEAVGSGRGGDINVSVPKLIVQAGGQILPRTFTLASGGNLTINASTSVEVIGFSPSYLNLFSNISAATFGPGNAGNLTLSTGELVGIDGIQIGSATFGRGSGGNVTVNASDITLSGVVPKLLTPSTINAATFNDGKAGEVTINASNLQLKNGGAVASSTTAFGDAGSVTINASSVTIDGIGPGSITPSLVDSSAIVLASSLQQQLRVPSLPSGNSGNVTINASRLSITNGGLANVQNQGPGNAGTLQVNARAIFLDNQGGITAQTASGEGGNIFLNAQNLQLRHNSLITASAGGSGKGGNITINTGALAALENSNISANAVQGLGGNISVSARDFRLQGSSSLTASALGGSKNGGNIALNTGTLVMLDSSSIKANAYGGPGGNIAINAQGIFRSPDSAFSASSRFGVSGTVHINVPYIDFSPATDIRVTPLHVQQFSSACSRRTGSTPPTFVNTGTGGTPPDSSDFLGTNAGWGNHPASAQVTEQSNKHALRYGSNRPELVPAQSWVRRPNGIISLIAAPPGTILSPSSPCFEQSRRNTFVEKSRGDIIVDR